MNIFVWITLQKKEKDTLKEATAAPQFNLTFAEDISETDRKKHFLEADIAFGNVPPDWLAEAKRLKWLQLESVGFGEYQEIAIPDGLHITNLRGMFSVPVAETALGGILSLYRGLDALVRLKENKKWMKNELRASIRTLQGAQAMIVGGGSIGETIKERLQALGTHVSVMDKFSDTADITSTEALDQQLAETDIVIVCLPETRETIHFFDQKRLSLLSPEAVFVNVGRGSVVDEDALIEKLNTGALGGCVLDVSQEEPLPENHPLWHCPNTILTQHTGGGSRNELLNKVQVFLANLERYEKDLHLDNVINIKRGY